MEDYLSKDNLIPRRRLWKHDFERVYIILHNVRLQKITEDYWFTASDLTGTAILLWRKQDWFPAAYSFENAVTNQGLLEDDTVYEVFFRYLLEYKIASIISVEKYSDTIQSSVAPASVTDSLGSVRGLKPATA